MKINLVFFMVATCLTLSCTIIKYQHENNSKNLEEQFDTIGDVKTKNIELAREVCLDKFYNFCDGGYDIPFRSYPAFVNLDTKNFIRSYDDTVYLIANPVVLDTLKKRNIMYKTPWNLDSLFQGKTTSSNTISFEVSDYQRRVEREIKRNNLKISFDGYLRYNLFKMNFQCVYGGKRLLIIPNVEGNNGKGLTIDKICNVYYIINIDSIK